MNATLALASPIVGKGYDTRERPAQRLVLYANELYRVPPAFYRLRVASGQAHVTHAGRDFILSRGQEATLNTSQDVALISPIKCDEVIVELYNEP